MGLWVLILGSGSVQNVRDVPQVSRCFDVIRRYEGKAWARV